MGGAGGSAAVLLRLLTFFAIAASIVSGESPSLIVAESTSLQLSPSVVLEKSPGLKPGSKVVCERVEIHGLSRLNNLKKFPSSVKVNVSYVNSGGRPPNIAVCFHRNASLGIGMCPEGQWEKLTKGSWMGSMSPFDYKLLDVRIVGSSVGTIKVSLNEEFYLYRIVFLVLGIVLMTVSSSLSNSLVFYYGGAMTAGVLLIVLVILFQGMKLLPTGRRSALAIVIYSAVVGLGSYLLSNLTRLFRSLLVEMGIGEDMYSPVALFLVALLVLSGAWLGFWFVRKLVLTEDGSIDTGVAHFVDWSIWIAGSILIFQSSVDPFLAVGAWVCGVMVSSVLKQIAPGLLLYVFKALIPTDKDNRRRSHKPVPSLIEESVYESSTRLIEESVYESNTQRISDKGMFYSSFHNTPGRRHFSKDQWSEFTKESTRKALEGLVASPDFSKWAVAHADRITLLPKKDEQKRRRNWLSWFS